LGLPVMHIFEEQVKEQVDPALYEERIGFLEMTLDVDAVRLAIRRLRGDETDDGGG
jgi:glycine/sarcosine/betaine reductase complex component A